MGRNPVLFIAPDGRAVPHLGKYQYGLPPHTTEKSARPEPMLALPSL